MNVDNGHLVKLNDEEELRKASKSGYTPVPKKLNHAVKRKLNGRNEAMVSLTSGGKLSKWAAKKRKRKAAQRSRRRNRK